MSTVTINVTLLGRTDLAVLVSDGQREAWVPFSAIEQEFWDSDGALGEKLTAIEIPTWLAEDKGLLQRPKDTDTADMFGDDQ